VTSRLRYWRCRLLHRERALCLECWLKTEAASKARHPTWRFW
jgi:hypothetical protein